MVCNGDCIAACRVSLNAPLVPKTNRLNVMQEVLRLLEPLELDRDDVSSEFKGVLPRRYALEMGLAVCAGYTLLRNTMKVIRFDFEKKTIFVFFVVFYKLKNITVSCLSDYGMMTWVQFDLYGETLRFFLFNNLLKTLHLPP